MTFSKLGTDLQTSQIVELPKTSRLQGLYLIGIQGTGKSGLIENLIMQDIKQQIGVCVLDPHGELIEHIIARLEPKHEKEVILLDIANEDYPFGLNLFACSHPQSPKAVQEVVDQVMHIFEKLGVSYDTPLILQYLYNCTSTLIANPGYTMADIPLLLSDNRCRQKLTANVTDTDVLLFWRQFDQMKATEQHEETASTLRRVRQFLQPLSRLIVGQSTTSIDLQQVMQEGKILLVKLSARLPSVTSLIGSVIIALLLNAAYNRPAQRRQFHLYADEFQRFATEDFATLLEEARKFGIGTTIAHQNRSQLDAENKQLETNLKDRSRSVGNLVVFRINSKDADDLAGEFDITPEEAWEEELEQEWFERVEEDVIDGDEEIDTPVKDVVGHLLRGGSHPNPVVNEFVSGWLRDLEWKAKGLLPTLNTILYAAMEGRTLPQTYPRIFFRELFYYGGVEGYIIHSLNEGSPDYAPPGSSDAFLRYWLSDDDVDKQRFYGYVREYIRTSLLDALTNEIGRAYWTIGTKLVGPGESPASKEVYPSAEALHFMQEQVEKEQRGTWYHIDIRKLDWEIETIPGQQRIRGGYDPLTRGDALTEYEVQWVPKPGQERKFYRPSELEAEVERLFFEEEVGLFEERIIELKDVMDALAEHPLSAGSGIRQPRKRKQINYHPHPRKTISHPQRPYQDVKNDIANQLSSLPNFTARTRIAVEGQTVEHTIMTIEPEKGLYGKALQERIVRIQAKNLQDGYVRKREEVEVEITQRQRSYSGVSAPGQPQQLHEPPRHARQVPVQGNCPNCGKSNSPGAKFCNQCGSSI